MEDDKAYLIDVKKEKALAKDPNYKRNDIPANFIF